MALSSVRAVQVAGAILLLFCVVVLIGSLDQALAQAGPFGAPRAPATVAADGGWLSGIIGWIQAKETAYYRAIAAALRASKADGSALWGLLGLSFAYGIFHAAGPGHGKTVISSYVVANAETWKRGVALSFASAMLQALVAVLIVAIARLVLNATAKTMSDAARYIEVLSYVVIALIGARLLWAKGGSFIAALRRPPQPPAEAPHPHDHHDHAHEHHAPEHGAQEHHAHDHACGHAHHHGPHDHPHGDAHDHAPGHDHHDHASAWGHAHGPEPKDLAGPGGWRRGLSAVVAVGLRPCSGAIIVLVVALGQGLFWAGVAATFIMGLGTAITVAAIAVFAVGARGLASRYATARPGGGMLVLRGIEVVAAALVMLFGLALAFGYMASERMFGF